VQYQKQQITQQQKLKMNPQLYQSIRLMALPVQELKFRIHEELENNPALEILEEKTETSLDSQNEERGEELEYFENSSDPGFTRGGLNEEASDSKKKFMEGALSRPENLHDHLLWQLSVQPITNEEYEIGRLLINNLDDNGFHIENPETLVKQAQLPKLHTMIEMIQGFEPVGVCVADYRESLLVQAGYAQDVPDKAMEALENYFTLLEKGKFDKLEKEMGITEKEVNEIVVFVKTLHPMPGIQFSTENSRYVIPDVIVRIKDGDLVLVLNDEEIPVLGINSFFTKLQKKDEIKDKGDYKDVQKYVKNKIKDAQWFIRSIHQRNETLLKISKALIEFQRDFFVKGPKYLIPLTLKDVADEVGVHETTVSRIANAKYMQTEWGVFEIKYFFSNSISGTGSTGSRFSKEGVKAMIKEILEEKTNGKKLSDQKISDELKKRGVNLARRTVTKYRKELDILSSYDR
jgi:RNA polymerase sigma-54 factor